MGCLFALLVAFAAAAATLATLLAASILGTLRAGSTVRLVSIAVLLLVAIAIAVAVRGVRRFASPLGQLVDAAGKIEAGDYSVRVPERGPPELRSVARAFNAMTARLRANEERRRSFLADVTHELRTPLSVIRGQAEAIGDGVYPGDADHLAPIIDAASTLEMLATDLHTLALSESGALRLAREHVDPAALVHDAVAALRTQAEAAGVSLTAEIAPDVPFADLDPPRIRSVIGNLISNALRHTPPGGAIEVGVRLSEGGVELTVVDTGDGIAPELLPHVFERFVRAPGSTGSGLGLAIAHDLVVAHGGTIAIESEEGSGTTVRVRLPAAP